MNPSSTSILQPSYYFEFYFNSLPFAEGASPIDVVSTKSLLIPLLLRFPAGYVLTSDNKGACSLAAATAPTLIANVARDFLSQSKVSNGYVNVQFITPVWRLTTASLCRSRENNHDVTWTQAGAQSRVVRSSFPL